ncbi:MAG: pyruvate dehydrogenase (acetyl-transferring) E1 component subunit alpha [Gammaproteobacteria bacterium]|nr:pyruvate dehydrogenase (acetyl-transferring) E1 component subunit alpha [Gammaproteobacteria bacterium]NNF61602.1 pyruvate dehydrogenase (acetyl-transferring) E1 component subunit alpha [Gammaproteobacteria bacterium]
MKKTVAEYRVDHLQILDPEGKVVSELPAFARDTDELLTMYRSMSLVRTFDTKAINLQRTGKLGTYASCLGHEATHVGVGAAMAPEDVFAPMYREYGAQMWRGVKMSEILLYWGGDERGNNFAGPKHDFPWCVPIATQCLHAAGAAMAFKLRGEKRCAVSSIGDGGTSEGAFYEALNLAGAQQLPAVFMVVNNKWAISVPLHLQTAAETLAQKAIAAGMPGIQVDGNDVIAVRAAVSAALERARSGGGPALIEAMTYRLSDHTTADDATRYRPKEEVEEAWGFEPLIRIRRYLMNEGLWDEQREQQMLEECAREVDAAVDEYLATPRMPVSAMFEHMYATLPEAMQEQLETAVRYEGTNGSGH